MKKFFVILAAVMMIGAFATTAMAVDWNFYGQARLATFYKTLSKENPSNPMPSSYDDSDTQWALQSNSRLGANVDAGDIKGRIEVGFPPSGGDIYNRLIYGDWNFGSGYLRVGRFYTPGSWFYSNMVYGSDDDLFTYGGQYTGRQDGIELGMAGFKVALLTPNTATITGNPYTTDTDIVLPKIELAYKFSTDMFFIDVAGGYNAYDVVNATDQSKGITSYFAALGGGANFGPAYVKASVSYYLNGAVYGNIWAGNDATKWDATKADAADTTSFGGQLVVGFKASDMITVEGGFSGVMHEIDVTNAKEENTIYCFYVQAPITIADGFVITPEIGMRDLGEIETKTPGATTKSDQGTETWFGAKWQINF